MTGWFLLFAQSVVALSLALCVGALLGMLVTRAFLTREAVVPAESSIRRDFTLTARIDAAEREVAHVRAQLRNQTEAAAVEQGRIEAASVAALAESAERVAALQKDLANARRAAEDRAIDIDVLQRRTRHLEDVIAERDERLAALHRRIDRSRFGR